MSAKGRRRGQPLLALAVLLGGWALVRGALWEAPFPAPLARAVASGRLVDASPASLPGEPIRRHAAGNPASLPPDAGVRPLDLQERSGAVRPTLREPMWSPPLLRPGTVRGRASGSPPATRRPAAVPLAKPGLSAGNQLMLLAGLAQLPMPSALAAAARPLAAPAPPSLSPLSGLQRGVLEALSQPRWSGDGWLFWRSGSGRFPAAGRASYGGSQAGAVLRYSLGSASGRSPAAHARFSRALSFRDAELAAGVSARPVAGVPVRLLAEARVQRAGSTQVRPAAALITELPPQPLPLAAEAEVYAQAGYVGGADATPFFDAQLTAERPALRAGPAELRVGAGVWAGGQKGATRLDLGPRATVRLKIAGGSSRLALDWRLRVAGRAEPGSGPTLTFSAGF